MDHVSPVLGVPPTIEKPKKARNILERAFWMYATLTRLGALLQSAKML
jgi:hypothetical protein